ncbi:hypothetical protein DL769_009796 [Monosporascus sp. CRB-8-3]|nr:hypothetical protein DL769_009796 [Monosporascus sp. CRB-8-3]
MVLGSSSLLFLSTRLLDIPNLRETTFLLWSQLARVYPPDLGPDNLGGMFQGLFASLEPKEEEEEDVELDFSEEQQGLLDQDIYCLRWASHLDFVHNPSIRVRADGCKKASPGLRRSWSWNGHTPSAFQFRLRGSKGLLVARLKKHSNTSSSLKLNQIQQNGPRGTSDGLEFGSELLSSLPSFPFTIPPPLPPLGWPYRPPSKKRHQSHTKAAAKKQFNEAVVVLHKQGVVTMDDVLLVQSVVGRGGGAARIPGQILVNLLRSNSFTWLTSLSRWSAPPINRHLLSPPNLPNPFFLSTTGNPAAASVYAATAAKKQLADAIVLHEQGVVTRDDVLLVQGVVGKGVGAPVYIAAGAVPPQLPPRPRFSSPRKAFLEKVHAAPAASTVEKEKKREGEEEGKGEAAGGRLVDLSMPPATSRRHRGALAVDGAAGLPQMRIGGSNGSSGAGRDAVGTPGSTPLGPNDWSMEFPPSGASGRTATTDSVQDDVQSVLDASAAERLDEAPAAASGFELHQWIRFGPDADEGLHFRGLFRRKLQKAADDFKVAKRRAGSQPWEQRRTTWRRLSIPALTRRNEPCGAAKRDSSSGLNYSGFLSTYPSCHHQRTHSLNAYALESSRRHRMRRVPRSPLNITPPINIPLRSCQAQGRKADAQG